MIRVGLTGGYATGKSFVALAFEQLGCRVIYADKLGHAVLDPGGEAYRPVLACFGPEILNSDGTIDRRKLAAIVFGQPDMLEKLTSFVHPAVSRLELEITDRFRTEDPHAVVIYEAAILIETGRYRDYDLLIVTACDEETQIARAVKRDHATREEVLSRLAKQLPLAEKKTFADHVIDTSGTKEETIRQVREIYQELRQLARTSETKRDREVK